ncbi:MAG: hypothetical protein H0V27_07855 [Pyrinomonadaceae bacterium]|nr:hypothetical protein [Pyrinomonadaceae bacterium]
MTHKFPRIFIAFTLTFALLAFSSPPAQACGPDSLRAVFSYSKHPDLPLDGFARGRLGVLRNTYARSYLLVAYRYMTGAGLNADEQRALVSLWNERLQDSWEREEKGADALDLWLAARGKVSGADQGPQVNVYRRKEYSSYHNCSSDSFAFATRTLNERAAKYGATDQRLKDWVAAQDQVFANCSGDATIPAALPSDADSLARQDRNYQIAAANFYAARFDEAKQLFDEIAGDAASPYSKLAPYLAARALIRKASLNSDEEGIDKQALAQARAQLERVLADKNSSENHRAARRMLNLVSYRLDPEARLQELSRETLRPNSGETIRQDVWDYTLLLNKLSNEDSYSSLDERKYAEVPKTIKEIEVADWLFTFQINDKDAAAHATERWAETRALPWLVAALSKTTHDDPKLAELLAASEKVDRASPIFPTVVYHAIRLLIDAGRTDEARAKLDRVLSDSKQSSLPPSAANSFLSQRMTLARDMREFLRYAQRIPVAITYDYNGYELPEKAEDLAKESNTREFARARPSFDTDAAQALNSAMPLEVLSQAVAGNALPTHLRRELALAVWVRAALLDDDEAGRAVLPTLNKLAPELREHLAAYASADSTHARRFAVLFAALKNPGLRPLVNVGVGRLLPINERESFRDNWWCAFEEAATSDDQIYRPAAVTAAQNRFPAHAPLFLTEAQRLEAAREIASLARLGAGPNYLARQAALWAKNNPNDPRAPEALHLAVRSTRYGCVDKETEQTSRAAFQLLHSRYGETIWAKRTPYWFKGYD